MISPAASQLEFDRLKGQWWWFEARHSEQLANLTAWAWEILRRTKAYGRFHEKASALPVPPPPLRSVPGTPLREAANRIFGQRAIYNERIRSMADKPPLGNLDPAGAWATLFLSDDDHCAPVLSWPELSETSRTLIATHSPILPRQDKPVSQFGFCVCQVLLKRGASGREVAYALKSEELVPAGKTPNDAVRGKHPAFSILPSALDQFAYAVIVFDTRAGEAAAEQLSEWTANNFSEDSLPANDWCQQFVSDAMAGKPSSLRKRYSTVVPSKAQYQAQAWIPMDCASEFEEIKAAFRTLLTPRQRSKWFPKCKETWDLPEEISLFDKLRIVRYSPYANAPDALKGKSAQPNFNTLKIGLAAFDCRIIERAFRPSGFLIPFLRQQSKWLKDPRLTSDNAWISVSRDALKSIRWRVNQIDNVYRKCWRP